MLFLSDTALIEHFKSIKQPLPVSLSALQKDRIDGRFGIPYRRIGGLAKYNPDEVIAWLADIPVVQPQRHPARTTKPIAGRRGKPLKAETVESRRRGITVPELRAQKPLAGV